MKRRLIPALLLTLVAGSGVPARAQMAVDAGAAADDFRVPLALFTRERATGYGMYVPRETSRFKQGESLLFYMEPVGYGYKKDGGLFRFGATIDLKLKQGGKALYSKDSFLNADFSSHHRNKEIDFTGSFEMSGAPPGEYALELLLQDLYGEGTATVTLPFTLE